MGAAPVLEIEHLNVNFAPGHGAMPAVRDVSLSVAAAETVGVVGGSGSGKTQLCMAAMGLLARNTAVPGSVRFDGSELLGAPLPLLNSFRGSKLTMVFQD